MDAINLKCSLIFVWCSSALFSFTLIFTVFFCFFSCIHSFSFCYTVYIVSHFNLHSFFCIFRISTHPSIPSSLYQMLADLLFISASHIQMWPLYKTTTNHRGQKYEINQTLLPLWPCAYWAAVKLSCYTLWMAPDGNCLEMADKFTSWAKVQNPLASCSVIRFFF